MTMNRLAPPAPPHPWRDPLLMAGLLLLVIAGLAGLAAATGWQATRDQILRLGALQVAALLALSVLNYLMRALRWHVFGRCAGLPPGLVRDLRHYLGGFLMSVTPGRVGELVRIRWIRRETGLTLERSAPLVLMDRAGDLVAMGLLLAGALALSTSGIAGAAPLALIAVLAALALTRARLLTALVTRLYRVLGLWPRLFGRLRAMARMLAQFSHSGVLAGAVGLGLIGWAAEGYAFHLLLDWMGAETGLWTAMAIFTFATLAGGLTGAPGGLGGAEAAMIALLTLEGVPPETSVAATAVIRVTTLWFAVGIGAMVFPIAERLSKRNRHAVENR
ncbi:flippase-like domain-containing protein [Rhodovulum tesquicola]|uniref:lysylphosphatidylglycerol synthase transmembrane domain-containing protein n=1 Tax=Rhodovulum tesquicola TaxID=540254 RepID=UPI00209720F0|nr:lysylphosphatidylglycerol synthase transmembrane domain-containing protein [Rhodovulum tesquicola]MCO8144134.1 flippase-like domain-containing protein [Rhodovulum tesquicola]